MLLAEAAEPPDARALEELLAAVVGAVAHPRPAGPLTHRSPEEKTRPRPKPRARQERLLVPAAQRKRGSPLAPPALLFLQLPPEDGLHTVNQDRRKGVWPLGHGAVADADQLGRRRDGPATESESGLFSHTAQMLTT